MEEIIFQIRYILLKNCTMTWFPIFLKISQKILKKWAKRAIANCESWRENCYSFDHFLDKQQNIKVSELNDFTNQILARKLLQFWSFFKPTKKSWLAKEIDMKCYVLISIHCVQRSLSLEILFWTLAVFVTLAFLPQLSHILRVASSNKTQTGNNW